GGPAAVGTCAAVVPAAEGDADGPPAGGRVLAGGRAGAGRGAAVASDQSPRRRVNVGQPAATAKGHSATYSARGAEWCRCVISLSASTCAAARPFCHSATNVCAPPPAPQGGPLTLPKPPTLNHPWPPKKSPFLAQVVTSNRGCLLRLCLVVRS